MNGATTTKTGIRRLDEKQNDGKHFANQKFYRQDFKGHDLSYADMRGCQLLDCVFDDADMTGANLTGANCAGSSFVRTRLYETEFTQANLSRTIMQPTDLFGATVTLHCKTFQDMKLDSRWLSFWLLLTTLMDVPQELKEKIFDVVGRDRVELFQRVQNRDF